MDHNNEQFQPENQGNGETYRYTVDANLVGNDYVPQAVPEKPLKSKKKIKPVAIVLASLSCVILVCFVAAFALLLTLNEEAALANTFETVLFDPTDLAKVSEIWAESGMSSKIDLELPRALTSLQNDLHIGINTIQTSDGKSKLELILDASKTKHTVELIYDEETLAIGGLCFDEQYVTLPRKNIVAALDGSVFHPDSDSDYAMKQEDYDDLRRALELLDPKYEDSDSKPLDKSFDRIAEQIRPYLQPETSIYFADGAFRLCKDVTYTLDTKDINDILDIVIDEAKSNTRLNENFSVTLDGMEPADEDEKNDLARDLKRIKKQFDELQIKVTYTVSGKKITDFRMSTYSVNKDNEKNSYDLTLEFVYDDDENGIDGTLKTVIEDEDDTSSVESELEYRKAIDGNETVYEAEIKTVTKLGKGKASVTERSELTLSYDHKKQKYHLCVEDDGTQNDVVDLEGTFKLDSSSAILAFTLDKITQGKKKTVVLEDFGEVTFKKTSDKDAFEIPEGNNLLTMTNTEFTGFLRDLQVIKLDKLATALTGQSLGFAYTVEEKLLVPANDAVTAAKKYCNQYLNYLSTEDAATRQNKAFVYDEDLDLYILLDYYPSKNQLVYDFAYELTDSMLNQYHKATPTSSGSMTVHKLSQIEFTPSDCTQQGKRVYHCEICDKTIEITTQPGGHKFDQRTSTNVTTDDGVARVATMYYCNVCGTFSHGSILNFCTFYVSKLENGTYRLDSYQYSQSYTDTKKYFCIPDEIYKVLPITEFDASVYADSQAVTVRIPNGVTYVTSVHSPYYSNSKLQILVLPATFTGIKEGAISTKNDLRLIFYCGTEDMWNKLQLGYYRTLWKDVQIVFCPEGITGKQVADSIIDPEAATAALAQKKQQVKTPETVRALAASDASVTLFDDSMVQAVAYDESTDTVALCKAYNGTSTDILLYNASTGALVKTVTVNDKIHTIDMKNGYLAMASMLTPTYYIYKSSDESMRTVAFKSFYSGYSSNWVNQIIIAGTKVYTCEAEQHCHIECYDLETDTQITVARMYEPFMKLYPEQERLVVLDLNCSPGGVCFINSATGEKIKEVDNYTPGFANKNNLHEAYVTDNGSGMYDLNGNRIYIAPTFDALDVTVPNGSTVLETVLSSSQGSIVVQIDYRRNVSMLLRSFKSTQTKTLDYYASGAIVTKSGDVLLFTEGGYGLILVKMN